MFHFKIEIVTTTLIKQLGLGSSHIEAQCSLYYRQLILLGKPVLSLSQIEFHFHASNHVVINVYVYIVCSHYSNRSLCQ